MLFLKLELSGGNTDPQLCESDEAIEVWMQHSLCDRSNRRQVITCLVGMASGARRRVGWKPEGPRPWHRKGSVHDSRSPQGRAPTESSGSSKLRIPSIHSLAHSRVPLEVTEL